MTCRTAGWRWRRPRWRWPQASASRSRRPGSTPPAGSSARIRAAICRLAVRKADVLARGRTGAGVTCRRSARRRARRSGSGGRHRAGGSARGPASPASPNFSGSPTCSSEGRFYLRPILRLREQTEWPWKPADIEHLIREAFPTASRDHGSGGRRKPLRRHVVGRGIPRARTGSAATHGLCRTQG